MIVMLVVAVAAFEVYLQEVVGGYELRTSHYEVSDGSSFGERRKFTVPYEDIMRSGH